MGMADALMKGLRIALTFALAIKAIDVATQGAPLPAFLLAAATIVGARRYRSGLALAAAVNRPGFSRGSVG